MTILPWRKNRVAAVTHALQNTRPARFCKDCRFVKRHKAHIFLGGIAGLFFNSFDTYEDAHCQHPEASRGNRMYLVSKRGGRNEACVEMRSGGCGSSGRLFERMWWKFWVQR